MATIFVIAVVKHSENKQLGDEGVYFILQLSSNRAGADGEAIDKSCLLTCFPWLAQAAFL